MKEPKKKKINKAQLEDILLLLRVLSGNTEVPYDSYYRYKDIFSVKFEGKPLDINKDNKNKRIVDRTLMLAELDYKYNILYTCDPGRYENGIHIKPSYRRIVPINIDEKGKQELLARGQKYLREKFFSKNDPNFIEEGPITQEAYLSYLRQVYGEPEGRKLKNKFEDASKWFKKIINKNKDILEIAPTKFKNGSSNNYVYYYKQPTEEFVKQYFVKQNVSDITGKNREILIEHLKGKSNDNVKVLVKSIERELSNKQFTSYNDDSYLSTLRDIVSQKFETAIYTTYKLSGSSNTVANLYRSYFDDILTPEMVSYNEMFFLLDYIRPIKHEECLDLIEKNAPKKGKIVQGKVSFDQMKEFFESHIEKLRIAESSLLPDVLYTYALLCIKHKEFETAENCFTECIKTYIITEAEKNFKHPILTYNEHCEAENVFTNQIFTYLELCYLYYKTQEYDKLWNTSYKLNELLDNVKVYQNINNMYYNFCRALLYNALSIAIYNEPNYYDAIVMNNNAYDRLLSFSDNANSSEVSLLILMLDYNNIHIELSKGNFNQINNKLLATYLSIEKLNLKTLDYFNLMVSYETAIAVCNMHLGKCNDAKNYVTKALKTYNTILHDKSNNTYSLKYPLLLKTLGDIYMAEDSKDKAEIQYSKSISECLLQIKHGDNNTKIDATNILINTLDSFVALCQKTQKSDIAIQQIEDFIDICDYFRKRGNDKYGVLKIKELYELADIYYNNDDIEMALKLINQAKELCGLILPTQYRKNIEEYLNKYEITNTTYRKLRVISNNRKSAIS